MLLGRAVSLNVLKTNESLLFVKMVMLPLPASTPRPASNDSVEPGDQIIVLPAIDTKLLQAVKDITQIVYQIAIAANVATN